MFVPVRSGLLAILSANEPEVKLITTVEMEENTLQLAEPSALFSGQLNHSSFRQTLKR